MIKKTKTYKESREALDKIALVSTHEHTITEADYKKMNVDLFTVLSHYVPLDFFSSGMTQDEFETAQNKKPQEKWRLFKPYIEKVKNTSFYRNAFPAFREIYGFKDDEITDKNWKSLSERITAKSKAKDAYRFYLKDKPNIERIILDAARLESNDIFAPVLRFDNLIAPFNFSICKKEIEKDTGISITKLDDCIKVLDKYFERLIAGKGVGVKTASAAASYKINYDCVSKTEAEKSFDYVMKGFKNYGSEERPYASYMMHAMVERAGSYNLPVQVHTGMQGGMHGHVENANPIHLASLMIDHPKTKFDIFHGGFPYFNELVALGKVYPNVYPDLCWMMFVSRSATKEFLHKLIDTVPNNKILAFGADNAIPEGTCAGAFWTRDIVAEVLAEKVEGSYFGKRTALYVAQRILRENAKELFKI